ncbi:MAG: hypothetical protein ABR592_00020 [Nitriliruptorales bacterium]
MELLAASAEGDVVGIGLVVTTFAFGLRHGIDWDHIAAITDIAGSQDDGRRALGYSTLYALGHAAVVFVIGLVAIAFGDRLPVGVDAVMERFVGATLLLLGAYVIFALIHYGRDFRMRSRWMLLLAGARRSYRRVRERRPSPIEVVHDHEHPSDEPHLDRHMTGPTSGLVSPHPPGLRPSPAQAETAPRSEVEAVASGGAIAPVAAPVRTHRHSHRHVGTLPDDPFANYGRSTSFGVGMIHGVGAETPTQVLIFLTAAGVGGVGGGVLLLVVFLVGLLVSNTAVAVMSSFGFLNASRSFPVYAAISVITALFSLALGALFLAGQGDVLPAFFVT